MAETIAEVLLVDVRLRTEALEEGLAQMRRLLAGSSANAIALHKAEAQAAEASAQRVREAQKLTAQAAQEAFDVIVRAIGSAIEAAGAYNSAMEGLRSFAKGAGESFGALEEAARSLSGDGLLSVADAAASLENLMSRGFSCPQAVEMIRRLKDASAYGRKGQLSLGEAVRGATEGLKSENAVSHCPAGGRPLAA